MKRTWTTVDQLSVPNVQQCSGIQNRRDVRDEKTLYPVIGDLRLDVVLPLSHLGIELDLSTKTWDLIRT